MKRFLRRLYFKLFPRYERLEFTCLNWTEADKLIKENRWKPYEQQWQIAKEEDRNNIYGMVFLERRKRITE